MVKWLAQAEELMGRREASDLMSLQLSSPNAIPFDRSQTLLCFVPSSQRHTGILKWECPLTAFNNSP